MATTQPEVRDFASPFEVESPVGCGGVGVAVPVLHAVLRGPSRVRGDTRWFHDGMHFRGRCSRSTSSPGTRTYMYLSQANTRFFGVPSALGIDHRVLYGWVYLSPNTVTDAAEVGRRAQHFSTRAGYYFSTGTTSTAGGRRRSRSRRRDRDARGPRPRRARGRRGVLGAAGSARPTRCRSRTVGCSRASTASGSTTSNS